jgi:hypothetical protein
MMTTVYDILYTICYYDSDVGVEPLLLLPLLVVDVDVDVDGAVGSVVDDAVDATFDCACVLATLND